MSTREINFRFPEGLPYSQDKYAGMIFEGCLIEDLLVVIQYIIGGSTEHALPVLHFYLFLMYCKNFIFKKMLNYPEQFFWVTVDLRQVFGFQLANFGHQNCPPF